MGSHRGPGDTDHPRLAFNLAGPSTSDVSVSAAGRHRIIALTNNYAATADGVDAAELEFLGWAEGATPSALRAMFDDYCDSSSLGMRYAYTPLFYGVFFLLTSRRGVGSPSVTSICSLVAGTISVRRRQSSWTILDCKLWLCAHRYVLTHPRRNLKAAKELGMETIRM
jgi:hypothetical protein